MNSETQQRRWFHQLVLLSICGGTAMGVAQIVITLHALKLGLDAAQIGALSSMHGLGQLLTVLPIGYLVDRLGGRRIFLVGGTACALLYSFFPQAESVHSLLLLMLGVGFFTSFRYIPMSSQFLRYLRAAGQHKAGWQKATHTIGLAFAGPQLGAFCFKVWQSEASFALVSSLFLLLVAGGVLIFPPDNRAEIARRERISPRQLLKDRSLVLAACSETLALATFAGFNAFIVVIAVRTLGLDQQLAAAFVSLEALIFIAAQFLLWPRIERHGLRRASFMAIVLSVSGLLLLAALSSLILLLFGTVLLGLGLGMFNLINIGRISRSRLDKGKVAGLFAMFTVSGVIIGPTLGGLAGTHFGQSTIFLSYIPFYLLLATAVWLHRPDTVPDPIRDCVPELPEHSSL